jgi:hypothetical protein
LCPEFLVLFPSLSERQTVIGLVFHRVFVVLRLCPIVFFKALPHAKFSFSAAAR